MSDEGTVEPANNYGELDFPLPMFGLAGAIEVIIGAHEGITCVDGASVWKFASLEPREILFISASSDPKVIIVAFDAVSTTGSVQSQIFAAPLIADDSVSVDDDASRYAEIAHEATDIVQMLGIVPDFLTAVDGVVFNGTMVARLFTHQAAHDLFALADSLNVIRAIPREAHETISLQDGHSQSAVLKAMGAEAVVFAASVTTRLDATLQAEDGFALSDSLRYALTLQAAETLLMAATAARSAEIALTAQDVAAFDDGSPVSRITSFIARDRFIITDQPANVAGEFRAPYYLWGDGRWAAFYGDGVSGTLKDKP